MDGNPNDNLVAIPPEKFKAICRAHFSLKLDERIGARPLGVLGNGIIFLATGSSFSEGWKHYGTVFQEAEARSVPGPQAIDHDAEYMKAMKEIYGLSVPPCRLMIGCSSEN